MVSSITIFCDIINIARFYLLHSLAMVAFGAVYGLHEIMRSVVGCVSLHDLVLMNVVFKDQNSSSGGCGG